MIVTFQALPRLRFTGRLFSVALTTLLLNAFASPAVSAEDQETTLERRIIIEGREQALVTNALVRLGDIASVSSTTDSDDQAVVALQNIVIDKSPPPGASASINAAHILEKLRSEGVNLNQVGYILPRVISLRRASRPLAETEIVAAIEAFLGKAGREAVVRKISFPDNLQVHPGEIELEANPLRRTGTGESFNIRVRAEGAEDMRFDVNAALDEWRELPVASRSLARGSILGAGDIAMARLNLAALPRDVIDRPDAVLGLRLNDGLNAGEAFYRGKLAIPPLIEAGSRVTMVYRSRMFEASATGVALEAGAAGQLIRIRNDSSKKLIMGTVLESGLVEVKP